VIATRIAPRILADSGREEPSRPVGRDAISIANLGLFAFNEADGETRTPDPFITSEVLYQLSYVGTAAVKQRA
jgi:hypothetical protein